MSLLGLRVGMTVDATVLEHFVLAPYNDCDKTISAQGLCVSMILGLMTQMRSQDEVPMPPNVPLEVMLSS